MAAILLAMVLSLLMQGSMCSAGDTEEGCLIWRQSGDNVCCDKCKPGNRMVTQCGPDPKKLCTPCEPDTYAADPKADSCRLCRQCTGDRVVKKPCKATADTQCDCKEGFLCGNKNCDFCVKLCGKGEEPTEDRSCRACGNGTFNDQIHQKCKPWSTKCPGPDQMIVALGNKFDDIKCATVDPKPGLCPDPPRDEMRKKPCKTTADTQCGCKEGFLCGNKNCDCCVKLCGKGEEPTEDRSCRACGNGTFNDQIHEKCKPWSTKCPSPDQKIVALGDAVNDIKCATVDPRPAICPDSPGEDQKQEWQSFFAVFIILVLMAICIFTIIFVGLKINKKRKTMKATITKKPIIRTPTDDPATLIAIECSFHEAQQEQGSSTESLASDDSAKQLIG